MEMEMEDRETRETTTEVKPEIFSKAVRAGKRTYFFDVKSTKADDYYLTVTESKKRFRNDGSFYYEKHKLFLYKEDFEKFSDALTESIGFINDPNRPVTPKIAEAVTASNGNGEPHNKFTDVSFEDLEKA
jgi:hypothetical protein